MVVMSDVRGVFFKKKNGNGSFWRGHGELEERSVASANVGNGFSGGIKGRRCT